MIHVFTNGDIRIDGPRIALSMYRDGPDGRMVPNFESPCPARLFIGQFKSSRPPKAFHWRCRMYDRTTSITDCRRCMATDEEKQAFALSDQSFTRPPGPPTAEDEVRFREFMTGFGWIGEA